MNSTYIQILSSSSSSSSSEYSAQGQVLHCKLRNQGRNSAQRQVFHRKLRNQGSFYQGLNRCGSFPMLSAPHSLVSIWTDLKIPENIPGAPTWSWGEWIWLTGPSGLYRNLPQGLNIKFIRIFDQIRDPEIQIICTRMNMVWMIYYGHIIPRLKFLAQLRKTSA